MEVECLSNGKSSQTYCGVAEMFKFTIMRSLIKNKKVVLSLMFLMSGFSSFAASVPVYYNGTFAGWVFGDTLGEMLDTILALFF